MARWFAPITLGLTAFCFSHAFARECSFFSFIEEDFQNDPPATKKILSLPKGTKLYGPPSTVSIAFSPDKKMLAAGGARQILVWDLSAGKTIQDWKTFNPIAQVSFSPGGKTLATLMEGENFVRFLNVSTGKLVGETGPHRYGISSFCYSPDGKMMACGTKGAGVYLWKLEKGKTKLAVQPKPDHYEVYSAAFTPDGKSIAALDKNNNLFFWDPATGAVQKKIKPYFPFMPDTSERHWQGLFAFSPDGKYLASWHLYSRISLWSLTGKQELPDKIKLKLGERIVSLDFSPDSAHLFLRCNTKIIQWRLADKKVIREFFVTGSEAIEAMALSSDGALLAAVTRSSAIYLWRTDTGKKIG